jgi:hypothetical protein
LIPERITGFSILVERTFLAFMSREGLDEWRDEDLGE